jgi:hypothetical protein
MAEKEPQAGRGGLFPVPIIEERSIWSFGLSGLSCH